MESLKGLCLTRKEKEMKTQMKNQNRVSYHAKDKDAETVMKRTIQDSVLTNLFTLAAVPDSALGRCQNDIERSCDCDDTKEPGRLLGKSFGSVRIRMHGENIWKTGGRRLHDHSYRRQDGYGSILYEVAVKTV
jgi:hypothetical protein